MWKIKSKSMLVIALFAILATPVYSSDFYVFTRVGGGTTVGCTDKAKKGNTLEEVAEARQFPKMCGEPIKKTKDVLGYKCTNMGAEMYIVRGKKKCEQVKAAVGGNRKDTQKLYAFFYQNKKFHGNCAPVIGHENIKTAVQALSPKCGKPIKTDKKSYAYFYCKDHGKRAEYYFASQKACRSILQKARQKYGQ